ncbi:SRPBCC domain-containing protein [Chloroflexi bacterium TSY]|nr:SRPBCC domain-containing protein [Chloroflexi bacterium TSY]
MILDSARNDGSSFERREIFAAKRARVFAAWTQADVLKKWWGPPGCITHSVAVDLRVGGQYRFVMQFPPDEVFHIFGVYREIQPPEKLVFTWRCNMEALDVGESIVTVQFFDRGNSTEVVLVHERILSLEARTNFERGWLAHFEKLVAYLTQQDQ